MSDPIIIRRAVRAHFAQIRQVEIAAFPVLRDAGAVSGSIVASSDGELGEFERAGLLFAAFDGTSVIGFVGSYVCDHWLHVREIDVRPERQKQGVGRRLMETAIQDGRQRELRGVSLTTDRFAPFNAPFYAKIGFQISEGNARPSHLSEILAAEERNGLDPERRVAMTLPL